MFTGFIHDQMTISTPFNQSKIKIYNSICPNIYIYIFHIQIRINQSIFAADIKLEKLS